MPQRATFAGPGTDDPATDHAKALIRFVAPKAEVIDGTIASAVGGRIGDDAPMSRLEHELLASSVDALPLFVAATSATLLGLFFLSDGVPGGNAWMSACAALAIACAVAYGIVVLRGVDSEVGRRWSSLALAGCVLLMMLLALLPWLPSHAPVDLPTFLIIGPSVVAAATLFAGFRRLAFVPLSIPASWLASELVRTYGDSGDLPERVMPYLWITVLALIVTFAVARARLARVADSIARQAEFVQLTRARQQAEQADHDKSRFLATASHDLRQPLHALGLFSSALENRLRGTDNEPVVRDIVQSLDGLSRSFNAIMDVSQLDAGVIRPNIQRFPVRDIFRRLHMHYAGQAELAGLTLRFMPGGKSITSDPQLLERILGNLVQNAIKYTVRGGVVVVARTTASHYNIEVWDSGLGISGTELPRVFNEFYQIDGRDKVRSRGLGMGLAIVKRLARLLGHDLTVHSVAGRGTMFRLGIPRGDLTEIEDVTAAADTLPMVLSGARTALIVDDHEANRKGLDLLLAEWGYQSVAAADLEHALYVLRLLEAPPDVILCDLHLGDGPDGIAVIESIRRKCGRELPAILMTGDSTRQEVARAVGSEYLVLHKPVQPRTLRHALRSIELRER